MVVETDHSTPSEPYRRWTKYSNPSIRYNPSPPKFNVIVTWSVLAPMDEKNQTPNITFANTRAENIEIWGCKGFT